MDEHKKRASRTQRELSLSSELISELFKSKYLSVILATIALKLKEKVFIWRAVLNFEPRFEQVLEVRPKMLKEQFFSGDKKVSNSALEHFKICVNLNMQEFDCISAIYVLGCFLNYNL